MISMTLQLATFAINYRVRQGTILFTHNISILLPDVLYNFTYVHTNFRDTLLWSHFGKIRPYSMHCQLRPPLSSYQHLVGFQSLMNNLVSLNFLRRLAKSIKIQVHVHVLTCSFYFSVSPNANSSIIPGFLLVIIYRQILPSTFW